MNKTSIIAAYAAACLALSSCSSMGHTTATTPSTPSTQTSSTQGTGSGILGSIMNSMGGAGNTIANTIMSVIGATKVTEKQLMGTWKYKGPGCAFTSEKALSNAGGEVVASEIKEKLEPHFTKLGLSSENTSISFNEDKTFKATVGGKSFSGTFTYNEATSQISLKAPLLNISCYAKRNAGGMSILFEAKKLLTLVQTLSMLSGNTTMQAVGEISKQYTDMRVGFDMTK